ncbi:hypothetical protein ATERTT37_001633 [Aspergillus terreus]
MLLQTAKRLGTIKIVSFDWLEDSLMSKTRKPKRETPYLLETILRTSKTKSEKTEKALISQKQTGKLKQKRIIGTTYTAILTRQLPSKTSREKYQVKVTYPQSFILIVEGESSGQLLIQTYL